VDRIDKANPRFHLTHGSDVNRCEPTVKACGIKQIVRTTQSVELTRQVIERRDRFDDGPLVRMEGRDDRKGHRIAVGGFTCWPRPRYLEEPSVNGHHLTVEVNKGARPKSPCCFKSPVVTTS
jgi:hypothetical protein